MGRKKVQVQYSEMFVENQNVEVITQKVAIDYKQVNISKQDNGIIMSREPYHSPNCKMCHSNKTIVYCTRNSFRYIKCRNCGFTFKNS